MLQLNNATPFAADRALLVSKDGDQIWTIVVKATYAFDTAGNIEVAPQQEPVCAVAEYEGEPTRTSLLRESEFVYDHPGTDVCLIASAYAPEQRPVKSLEVSATVGPVHKTLRIFGQRWWRRALTTVRISAPEYFVKQAIRYEHAYGGTVDAEDGTTLAKEPRNPIGRGFARSKDSLVDCALPNIEDPRDCISRWSDRPAPAGFGPIPPMWLPRLQYAGSYDAAWRRLRMPLLPADYDARHALAAHPDLTSHEPLRGGEDVVLKNLTPESLCRFRLPRTRLVFRTYVGRNWLLQDGQLDRVIIEPDARKLVMVWRSTLNCHGNGRSVRATSVELKPWRSLAALASGA